MKKTGKTTIKDIAKKLGIAHSTVSMVMNDSPLISKVTKDKVLMVAKQLNYVTNKNARALVSGRTGKIAVLIQNFGSAFAMGALAAIERKIKNFGYELAVFSDESDKDMAEKILQERAADALIVVTVSIKPAVIDGYKAAGIPLILIEDTARGKSDHSVILDNKKAGYEAAQLLIKNGAKKIALLTGPLKRIYNRERYEGFRSALSDYNLKYYPELTYTFRMHSFDDGRQGFEFLKGKKYDAVFAAGGDSVAAGYMREAALNGVKIPQNVRVIGFDDTSLAEAIGLTSIRQPFETMGLKALEIALRAIKKQPNTRKVEVFEPMLVERATT